MTSYYITATYPTPKVEPGLPERLVMEALNAALIPVENSSAGSQDGQHDAQFYFEALIVAVGAQVVANEATAHLGVTWRREHY